MTSSYPVCKMAYFKPGKWLISGLKFYIKKMHSKLFKAGLMVTSWQSRNYAKKERIFVGKIKSQVVLSHFHFWIIFFQYYCLHRILENIQDHKFLNIHSLYLTYASLLIKSLRINGVNNIWHVNNVILIVSIKYGTLIVPKTTGLS